jgi:hypothetical protein
MEPTFTAWTTTVRVPKGLNFGYKVRVTLYADLDSTFRDLRS